MVTKPKLRLSFASGVKDRIAPLLDGRVQPEGIELIHTFTTMSDGAWRHLNFHEFQVHELSVSSYMIAKAQGMDVIAMRKLCALLRENIVNGLRKCRFRKNGEGKESGSRSQKSVFRRINETGSGS